MRLAFIVINVIFVIFGTSFLNGILLYILLAYAFAVCVVVYRTQRYIWAVDMEDVKNRKAVASSAGDMLKNKIRRKYA